ERLQVIRKIPARDQSGEACLRELASQLPRREHRQPRAHHAAGSRRRLLGRFLFIVRSRNSCINDPIRSTSSSNAKWPVSRRWSSAPGISLLKRSAPSTVKIPSFLPQVISVGGCCLRKYSCQSAYASSFIFALEKISSCI